MIEHITKHINGCSYYYTIRTDNGKTTLIKALMISRPKASH
jgi:hypothetical protein